MTKPAPTQKSLRIGTRKSHLP